MDTKGHGIKKRRYPIFAFAICFLFAYLAEKVFSIADITGAYFAGLMLSSSDEKNYIDRRSEIVSYVIFTPVFFANIGLNIDFTSIDPTFIGFGIAYILVGLLGKVIGCGVGALMCKYSFKDSLRVGIGMMARAEVCLITAQRGLNANLISASIMPFLVIMIMISSFVTPLLLKISYNKENKAENVANIESAK